MKKYLQIGMLSMLLTGCSLIDINNFFNSNYQSSSQKNSSSQLIISGDYKNQGLKGSEYLKYYSEVSNCVSLPSIGAPKILVVPVLFKGVKENTMLHDSSRILNDLELVFNGDESDTGYESVNSYYKKSSYGKLDIQADVYDNWVTIDKTINDLTELSPMMYEDPSCYVVDFVTDYLINQGIDMKQYDTNSDGFIDGLWLVYGSRNSSNLVNPTEAEENVLWAYTYWKHLNNPNINSPKANVYCWGSYDFMYESAIANHLNPIKIDAHTYIHETGHMLGLDDYYDYDDTANPTGCLDMMDYNIGDHNAYSKYLLDWVEPIIFDADKLSYTLKPFESSGDCLVIPAKNDVNKSPLNEYLIIEFYTPTGLNEMDSTREYLGQYPKLFTKNGIKIYHVDSRLGELVYQGLSWSPKGYIYNYSYNDLVSYTKNNSYFSIISSNTPSYSYSQNYKLLSLVSGSEGQGYMYKYRPAENKDLFSANNSLNGFSFNCGSKFDFNLIVESVSNSEAKLYFESK